MPAGNVSVTFSGRKEKGKQRSPGAPPSPGPRHAHTVLAAPGEAGGSEGCNQTVLCLTPRASNNVLNESTQTKKSVRSLIPPK